MSLMSKFFNNTRKPKGFLGKMMVNGMNGNMDVFRRSTVWAMKRLN